MEKLDEKLKEALEIQRKIGETIKFIKENEKKLTEEQSEKLNEIKYKIKKELLPEIEKLDKNNSSAYKSEKDYIILKREDLLECKNNIPSELIELTDFKSTSLKW